MKFIIKAATGNIKMRTMRNLLFSLNLQAVRINNQGALLLGFKLAKSIYYLIYLMYSVKSIRNNVLNFPRGSYSN